MGGDPGMQNNDHKTVLKFRKENIFLRFGILRAVISNKGLIYTTNPLWIYYTSMGANTKSLHPIIPKPMGKQN